MEAGEEPVEGSGNRLAGCLIQAVGYTITLVVGIGLGVVGAQMYEVFAHPELAQRPEGDLSRSELLAKLDASEKAYADLLAQTAAADEAQKAELKVASEKVTQLSTDVETKQAELKVLEEKAAKSKNKSASLTKQLNTAKEELAALQAQLDQAIIEKQQIQADLDVSRQETVVARQETAVAKGQTVDARWDSFKNQVVLEICEKGTKNKLANCRESVAASLNSARASRYKQCLGSGQAAPSLRQVPDKKDFSLPNYSEWIDRESKYTEDYYIIFCDPTLPEANVPTSSAPTSSGVGTPTGTGVNDGTDPL